jgi:hypothetical protein
MTAAWRRNVKQRYASEVRRAFLLTAVVLAVGFGVWRTQRRPPLAPRLRPEQFKVFSGVAEQQEEKHQERRAARRGEPPREKDDDDHDEERRP